MQLLSREFPARCVQQQSCLCQKNEKEQQRGSYWSLDPPQLFKSKVMNLHSREVKRRWLHHPPLPRLFSMRQSFLTIPIFGWFSGLPGSLFKWTQLYHCPYLCPLVDSWSLPLLPVSCANYITTCIPAIIFVDEIKVRSLAPQPAVCSPVSAAVSR